MMKIRPFRPLTSRQSNVFGVYTNDLVTTVVWIDNKNFCYQKEGNISYKNHSIWNVLERQVERQETHSLDDKLAYAVLTNVSWLTPPIEMGFATCNRKCARLEQKFPIAWKSYFSFLSIYFLTNILKFIYLCPFNQRHCHTKFIFFRYKTRLLFL